MTSTITQFTQDRTYDGPLADVYCGDRSRWCDEHSQGFVCTRQRGHDAEHVASGSTGYQYQVWPQAEQPQAEQPQAEQPQAEQPQPEPEDELTAYKRQIRDIAQRKLRDGFGDTGTWNATLKRLGIEPLTKRTIRVTAPIHRVRIELGGSDYTEDQAREWLALRRDPATLAGYLRPDPDDLRADEAEVVVEETAEVDDDLDSDEDYRASGTDLDTYKELVKEAAGDLQERHSWCDDGTNTVLRELGILIERDYRVDVRIRAYQTVTVTVTANSEDDAINLVDYSDISNRISYSDWEWDGDWDSDDMSAEEDD